MYDHRYTATYQDCLERYRGRADVLASLSESLVELARQPFGNPKLETHRVKRAADDTFTSHVGNHGHRLIWRRVDNVLILLLFGEHEAVYRRAERLRLEIDDSQNVLRVYDQDPVTERPVPYSERRSGEGRLFMAWNDRELTEFGLDADQISVLRRLDTEDELIVLDDRHPDRWRTALNLITYANPDGRATSVGTAEAAETEAAETEVGEEVTADPTMPAGGTLGAALRDTRSHREFVPVPADELARVLARPIEDWMVYLDPNQESLVRREMSGPARVRGAAGTGKTVVALHRARRLAAAGKRVLVTTYVRNLPEVYRELFGRFAPECDGVEFSNVHRWALGYLYRNDVRLKIDTEAISRAWGAACRRELTDGSALKRAGLTRGYLQQEIEWVIKGRALTSLDDYLKLERSGRGTPLGADQRTALWRLYERYQRELTSRRACDFTDVLLRAAEVASASSEKPFDCVIVDEAQDLTEAAMRLLSQVVDTGAPDSFLVVGDGQQSVYPGGFSLGTLGIQIRGRSFVLTHNYRNTREIYDLAAAVAEQSGFDDGGTQRESGRRVVRLSRHGAAPVLSGHDTEDDHDLALCAAIQAAVDGGTGSGDLAVLLPTNVMVRRYRERIESLGLPAQDLTKYNGEPNRYVKVGTYQRAKGLEFKHVFLPRLDPDGLHEAKQPSEDDDTYAERLDLTRRQLFVAMTRARDALWLGWLGTPAQALHTVVGKPVR
ncbi:hypothetical protein Athai_46520 [Actinocatenispora thailandica]|uniref:DNA 3'-5' helicase n=1 Tax=Actinocatenispora thailandica TaxID=227318 RepID=A0A7R7DST2_9ACTN|nr:UvrD-helicase domain-containing protein [Actinocatenispora thailandica]BCJ37149.1 hypothetical protein Athai_46520 [Actinocatenispora thailandica]